MNLAVKIAKFSLSKLNFLSQKSSESFDFFSLKNMKSGAQLIFMALMFTVISEALYLLRFSPNFKPSFQIEH
jgi:hypothetical protein